MSVERHKRTTKLFSEFLFILLFLFFALQYILYFLDEVRDGKDRKRTP